MTRVANRKLEADALLREYRRGMSGGLDEQFFKKVSILFERIDELEIALSPFAATADREGKFGGDLYHVHAKSCERALDVLDPSNSVQPARKKDLDFGIPVAR